MSKLVTCLFVIVCGTLCWAQSESLLIGPGDQLSVQVLEAPELSQHARVTDSGNLPLILGGEVKVAGLTPEEAAAAIERVLVDGHYLLHPHVSVSVDQYATANVTVMGEVGHPGSYPIGTPRTILDVLALAGGTTDLASRNITIERHGSDKRDQYFLSNKSSVAFDTNAEVYPGDIVLVPKIDVVYIMGDVGKPGGYPMATNDGKLTLLQAVALAGTQTPSAVPNATRLIRKQADGTYVEMTAALSKMEKGKRSDIILQPGDIVYIPFSYLRNMASNLTALVAAASTAVIYHD